MMPAEKEGQDLIILARDSILSEFSGSHLEVHDGIKKKYSEKQGCFVTLNINSDLRGCIGFTEPIYPLWEAISNAAKAAAFQDPRFPPLKEDEFKKVKIEVSVLTKPEEIKGKKEDIPKHIKIGRDGLIIESPMGSGLLLPQVFTEYKVDAKGALDMTCHKAGLQPGSWKNEDCKVLRFEAKIFK